MTLTIQSQETTCIEWSGGHSCREPFFFAHLPFSFCSFGDFELTLQDSPSNLSPVPSSGSALSNPHLTLPSISPRCQRSPYTAFILLSYTTAASGKPPALSLPWLPHSFLFIFSFQSFVFFSKPWILPVLQYHLTHSHSSSYSQFSP